MARGGPAYANGKGINLKGRSFHTVYVRWSQSMSLGRVLKRAAGCDPQTFRPDGTLAQNCFSRGLLLLECYHKA